LLLVASEALEALMKAGAPASTSTPCMLGQLVDRHRAARIRISQAFCACECC
jgi:hypothetical protein